MGVHIVENEKGENRHFIISLVELRKINAKIDVVLKFGMFGQWGILCT